MEQIVYFCENHSQMNIAEYITNAINRFSANHIFTRADFDFALNKKGAAVIALNRTEVLC